MERAGGAGDGYALGRAVGGRNLENDSTQQRTSHESLYAISSCLVRRHARGEQIHVAPEASGYLLREPTDTSVLRAQRTIVHQTLVLIVRGHRRACAMPRLRTRLNRDSKSGNGSSSRSRVWRELTSFFLHCV